MKKLALLFGYFVLFGIMFQFASCSFLAGRNKTNNEKEITFIVKRKITVSDLAKELKNKGIIDEASDFIDVAKTNGLTDKTLAAGKYRIKSKTKMKDLVIGFVKNKKGQGNNEVLVKVLVYKFRDINQMASMAHKCLELDSSKLINYLEQAQTIKQLGFKNKEELSALFIPGEYQLHFDTDEKEFVKKMKEQFDSFWTANKRKKLKQLGLKSPADAVKLASIVYAEQSRNKEEWPIISALYLNRLKKDMKLQSDPTFRYCWGDALKGTQRLLEKHREIDCAYNTYKIKGLPPGPICFTPTEVIDAVLNPADVNFLFMCATPDYSGKHNFAVSDVEHVKNAKKYQSWIADQESKKK
jgi:UPF0755 protein